MSVTTFAKTEKTVATGNEYGGVTKEITYSKGDANYKRGIIRMVVSYDSGGNKKKIETYSTPSNAEKQGWHKTVTYYWGKGTIGEAYSTDSHSEIYGFDRMIVFMNSDGQIEKREFILRENSVGAKLGIEKRVIYYDSNGYKIRSEALDRFGNPVEFSLEQYKAVKKEMQGRGD
jgi:hypothetical protein